MKTTEFEQPEPITPPANEIQKSEAISRMEGLKVGAALTAFAFQQSPANEALRAYAGVNVLAQTNNPITVGIAVGAITLVIEAGSSLTIANAMQSDHKMVKGFKSRFKKGDSSELDKNNSRLNDTALALGVGAGAVVTKRHLQGERTMKDDVKTSLRASGAIAGFSAGVAGLAGGGIEYAEHIGLGQASEITVNVLSDWRTYVGGFAVTQVISFAKNRFIRNRLEVLNNKVLDSNINMASIDKLDIEGLSQAADFEQQVWDQNDFGSLDDYKKYDTQSKVFAAYKNREIVGVTRMFEGGPELPPFMDMKFYDQDERTAIVDMCSKRNVEELGTTAVDHEKSGVSRGIISLHMWRIAYRDAINRGIKHWGIIMEPERVEKMNKRFNFTFKQLGPTVDYQGGDCAPFLMDLQEVDARMQRGAPELYKWFVKESLS